MNQYKVILKVVIVLIMIVVIGKVGYSQPSPPPPPTAPSGVPIDGGVLALIGGLGAYLFKRYFKNSKA